jgi:hypothetical protein
MMTSQAKKKATAEVIARYRKQVAELEHDLSLSFEHLFQRVRERKLETVRKKFLPHD